MRHHGKARFQQRRRRGAALIAAVLVLTGLGTTAASAAATAVEVTAKLGGDPVTVRTAEPGQDAIVAFQAVAGQRALVEITDIRLGSMWVYLRDTKGATLRQASCGDGVDCVLDTAELTASGRYSVYLDASQVSYGVATVRLHEVPPDVTAGYTIGDPATTVTMDAPGQNAYLVFKGRAGQRIFTRVSAGTTGVITAYLLDPAGVSLGGGVCDVPCDIDATVLRADGEHRLLLSPSGVRTGSLTAQVLDVPADVEAVTGIGRPAPVTTTAPGQNARVLFDAEAGAKVTVAVSESGFTTGRISLHGPKGETLASGECTRDCALTGVPLTASGTHSVLLDPAGAQTGTAVVTITISAPDVLVGVVPGGDPVTLTVVEAGQNAAVVFGGAAKQHVSAVLSKGSLGKATASLRAPDGTVLVSASCATACFLDVRSLPAAGRYTLHVDPDGANTGSITVQVHDVPADAVVTAVPGGDAVPLTTAVPGQNGFANFAVKRGERTFVQLIGGTFGNAPGYLRDPSGTDLASSQCASGCVFDAGAATVDGTYRIALDPQGAETGGITVRVFAVPADAVVPTAPGRGPVPVATTTPGQGALVVFDAVAGQRLSARLGGGTFGGSGSASAGLRRPDGSWLVNPVFCGVSCFLDAVTADATGTYTLFVDPQGAAVGSITAEVFDVVDAAVDAVAGGDPVGVRTGTPGQNAVVSFRGGAGMRVSVRLTGGTFGAATATLRGPDGITLASLGSCGSTCFADTVTLPAAGAYSVLINPSGAAVGSGTVQVHDVPPDASASVTVGGGPATVSVTVPGQNAAVTFDGAAGQVVTLVIEAGTGTTAYQLRGADGTLLASRSGTAAALVTLGPVTLTASGTQTLTLNPGAHAVGSSAVTAT
ncbi:hypothetical protein J2S43_000112 [Catenuloplanes nepalensis]|uniref:Uncharacterized protein n=1 Tax=Catenuloplanes nepalensis TaxID=587533 RepID=A0ABT9MJK2_9ACTN|nr:hypothetical protein [Catenuloplanes nepalensis]MDP9791600.1 hypothetical protein [Catenuloplanes nepalensis]